MFLVNENISFEYTYLLDFYVKLPKVLLVRKKIYRCLEYFK